MRAIEKRIIDDPINNIATRELAINQAKKWRKAAKTAKEKRDLDSTISRLEGEVRAIEEKKNLAEQKQALLHRLDKIQKDFNDFCRESAKGLL